MLTLGGFLALVSRGDVWWLPVALMAAREFWISIYRVVAGKKGISLPAARLGKFKAFFQMLTVGGFVWPLTADIEWLTVVAALVRGRAHDRLGHRHRATRVSGGQDVRGDA